jgi:hypothetical protein
MPTGMQTMGGQFSVQGLVVVSAVAPKMHNMEREKLYNVRSSSRIRTQNQDKVTVKVIIRLCTLVGE